MNKHREQVIEGLTELLSATAVEECLALIERQGARRFAPLRVLAPLSAAAHGESSVPLVARGRLVGRLALDEPQALARLDLAELNRFAEHAAIALDNARLLEDHRRRACSDPLTGLLDRGEFQEALALEVARAGADPAGSLSLAVFDLDGFKKVNDRGGQVAGDRLLRGAAAALTAACRASDAAFRIGGDEFALILGGADGAEAGAIAERAAAAITGLDGSAGTSWGVATLPTDGVTPEALVALADSRMYAHKGRPRQSVLIQRAGARQRLEVATRLSERLTRRADPETIAATVVQELHSAFGYYLAVIQRRHDDGVLRVVAAAGRLAESDADFLAREQPIGSGVNGRVARTAQIALVNDTRVDPDYLGGDPRVNPGSELSVPILVEGRVWGVLNLEQLATYAFDEDDVLLVKAIVAQTGAALHRCQLVDEMERSFSTVLAVLCDALETKDPYTADHAEQVAELALATGQQVGLAPGQARALRYCALLHDIGKLGVRGELLRKPAALIPEEYEEVQRHSELGATLLERMPLLADIAPLVRAVHERWDGTGYPDRLAGAAIPIESRVVAVCDAWHAMTSDRPYRRALGAERALAELRAGAGGQFDPQVVAAFSAGWEQGRG